MARPSCIVLVGAVLVVLVAQSCVQCWSGVIEPHEIHDDHLGLPKKEQFGDSFHVNVRDALLKLEIDDSTHVDEVAAQLRTLQKTNQKYADIYRELELIESCTKFEKLAAILKSIEAQRRVDPESDYGKLARKFIDGFVKAKFFNNDYNNEASKLEKTFEPFEEVFARFFGIERRRSGEWKFQLIQPLSELNLAKSDLDVKKLIEAAKRWGGLHLIDSVMQSRLWPFEQFMYKYCDRLQGKQDVVEFNKVDAVIYEDDPFLAARSARQTYYYGLCAEWLRGGRRMEIMANLNKRLEEQTEKKTYY